MYHTIHEECGVFGIFGDMESDVAMQAYIALYALQHRGQESCGIAVNDDGVIRHRRGLGLVPDVFAPDAVAGLGRGNMAVGHVRYGDCGLYTGADAQPLVVRHRKGTMVIAHNGAIVNADILRDALEAQGAIFHSATDAEVLSYIITRERLGAASIEEAVSQAMMRVEGAYSLLIMSPSKLIAVRDPHGFRPLCMGRLGDSVVFASETCALDGIGAAFTRDLRPGEVVTVTRGDDGNIFVKNDTRHCHGQGTLCVFEYVYFARPDSVLQGVTVHAARLEAGRLLAKECPADADVVIGVPDSGLDAALGFSQESDIPYGLGFIKNRYVARTFIQPTQGQRDSAVRIKLNAVEATVRGKRVVMIDDSIVRGTTCGRIVRLLREAGAREVHMRVSAPPFRHPCYFGTDIDSRDKLIANRLTIDEIAAEIGADSLGFLSVEGVRAIAPGATCGLCDGCFTGVYPVPEPAEPRQKSRFDQKISGKQYMADRKYAGTITEG